MYHTPIRKNRDRFHLSNIHPGDTRECQDPSSFDPCDLKPHHRSTTPMCYKALASLGVTLVVLIIFLTTRVISPTGYRRLGPLGSTIHVETTDGYKFDAILTNLEVEKESGCKWTKWARSMARSAPVFEERRIYLTHELGLPKDNKNETTRGAFIWCIRQFEMMYLVEKYKGHVKFADIQCVINHTTLQSMKKLKGDEYGFGFRDSQKRLYVFKTKESECKLWKETLRNAKVAYTSLDPLWKQLDAYKNKTVQIYKQENELGEIEIYTNMITTMECELPCADPQDLINLEARKREMYKTLYHAYEKKRQNAQPDVENTDDIRAQKIPLKIHELKTLAGID